MSNLYKIKKFVRPKMSLNSREFLIRKDRGKGSERERGAGGQVSRQAYLRFGRDRGERQRDREA
jgi:hypothetical protein